MRALQTGRRGGVALVTALAFAASSGCSGGEATATNPTPTPPVSGTTLTPTTTGTASAGASGSPTATPSPRQVVTGTAGATGSGAPVPWDTAGASAPATVPSAASGSADLTILLDDGFGIRTTWTLRCDPPGGTHPTPARACGVLGASGATALPPVAPDTACTQQYGGPQKAKITGTWRGKKVDSELSLEDGCQIARWTALLGLLPPGGVPGA